MVFGSHGPFGPSMDGISDLLELHRVPAADAALLEPRVPTEPDSERRHAGDPEP